MKVGVAEWYSDKGGIGEEKIFSDFVGATKYIREYWNNCTVNDRRKLTRCFAYEAEISVSELEAYQKCELEVPLTEYQAGGFYDITEMVAAGKLTCLDEI